MSCTINERFTLSRLLLFTEIEKLHDCVNLMWREFDPISEDHIGISVRLSRAVPGLWIEMWVDS